MGGGEIDQAFAQGDCRRMGQATKHDVRKRFQLLLQGSLDAGMSVAMDGSPPGGHPVDQLSAIRELEFGSGSTCNLKQGCALRGRIRVPDPGAISFRQGNSCLMHRLRLAPLPGWGFTRVLALAAFCAESEDPVLTPTENKERKMQLYTGMGPNPRVVAIFIAEKGIEIPLVEIDLLAGENRHKEHLARNPAGQLPCLMLDNGLALSEITAICEYIEEQTPAPPLFGTSAEERAETRMWTRRLDLNIVEPMTQGFRNAEGQGIFKDRIHLIPQAADDQKAIAQENLAKLQGWMGEQEFICGSRFSMADIHLYAFLEFGASVGQPMDAQLEGLHAWFSRVAERPSIDASR